MKTGLPALISSSNASTWASCRVITPNLERAYRRWLGEKGAHVFKFGQQMTDYEVWNLAKDIRRAKPDHLVFLDHRPKPAPLIRALREVYAPKTLPPCTIHVYGDFSLDAWDWLTAERALKKGRVRLVAASERQFEFVSRALSAPEGAVGICPFPVDPALYGADVGARARLRKKRGVEEDELIFAYSGRLTLQKNTDRLLREFSRFVKTSPRPARLWMAGGFDDLGAPFFGVNAQKGKYYQSWNRELLALPPAVRSKVEYFGVLDAQELREFCNAADVFVSLSLHHDEDFGMSPAEALCCGTPAVLTDWGGYASFQLDRQTSGQSHHCQLVPVRLDSEGLSISSSEVIQGMKKAVGSAGGAAERAKRAELYASRFSIDAAAAVIRDLHSRQAPPFAGFNWRFRELGRIINTPVPYPDGPTRGSFYEEIYGHYFRSDRLVPVAR